MGEVEFRREMNRNYMVLKPGLGKNEEYTARMLTENRIPGFLPFREKQVDGERWFYYDVTSRQPLERILEHRNLRGKELERLAADLLFSLKQAERYLLDENSMDLTPEMIYVDLDSFQCSFCLVPGSRRDFSQGFRELSQYLLDHVDHRDGEAVVLAFAIFRESRKENFGLEEIGKCLEKARAEPGAGKNGEAEEEVSRNRTGGQTGMEEEKGQDPWKMDTENGEPGTGEWTKERKTEKSSSRICGSDHGKVWEKDRILKTAAIAAGILMAVLPAFTAAFFGFHGLFQYKWILGAAEMALAAVEALLLSGAKAGAGKGKAGSRQQEERGPEREAREKTEPWEVYFREEEADAGGISSRPAAEQKTEKEEEFQTILLAARPLEIESRKLTAFSGDLEIPLTYFPFLIGKSREMADFCLNEPGVSRLHVKIEEKDGAYTITDLNSTNGTKVNGTLLEANETCSLEPGSEVEIAGRRFRFR